MPLIFLGGKLYGDLIFKGFEWKITLSFCSLAIEKQGYRISPDASDLIMALNLIKSCPNLSTNYHIEPNSTQTLKYKKFCLNFVFCCAANIDVLCENYSRVLPKLLDYFYLTTKFRHLGNAKTELIKLLFYYQDVFKLYF